MPPPVLSDGPILLIVFSSGPTQGQGFKARYTFQTDYKVPGTPSSLDQCHFTYSSASLKEGNINSPRFPSNYPSNTYCIYEFIGLKNEQVKLIFNYFKLNPEKDVVAYNDVCKEDWLEVYEIHPDGREVKFGRFCATSAPGPIITDVGVNSMKVILSTDDSGVASGFSASYSFIEGISAFGGINSELIFAKFDFYFFSRLRC